MLTRCVKRLACKVVRIDCLYGAGAPGVAADANADSDGVAVLQLIIRSRGMVKSSGGYKHGK